MEFEITKASVDDLDEVVRLYKLCLEGQGAQRGVEMFLARESRPEPLEDSFRQTLAEEHSGLWLGRMDGEVFGLLGMHMEVLRDGYRHAMIDEIYVEPEARAVGLGEEMMEVANGWARDNDAVSVDAVALPGDRDTKNFFEMSGYTARLLVMHHKLNPTNVSEE